MKDKTLYAKNGVAKVKVGTIVHDVESGLNSFIKHKPHYMNVLGGYGIQKIVSDEKNKEWNLKEVFQKHPELVIVIPDITRDRVYYSTAKDWNERGVVKNYGFGEQIFMSAEYMKADREQLNLI